MNYRVKVRTLTPLHIGSGADLLRDYDYVTGQDRTFVLNQDAVLADAYERTHTVPDKPAGKLIAVMELRDGSPFVRYSLAGVTRLDQMHEQIKDARGQCYLPGSSFKGALRTVLMAHAIRTQSFTPDMNLLKNNKSWASQSWERAVFGRDPNHDLLRALQIADSAPLTTQPAPLMLVSAGAFMKDKSSVPIAVEAVAHNTTFETMIHIEDWLLQDKQASELGWGDKTAWLTQLPALANARAQERMRQEMQFAQSAGFEMMSNTLAGFLAARLKPNQFLMQMGWGTGWTGTTIGTLLAPEDQNLIRKQFQLGRPPGGGRDWTVNTQQSFPKSRRLHVARVVNATAEPGVPLGWVLVEMASQ